MKQSEQPRIRGLARVLGYLYLGNEEAADDKDELDRLGITEIINCVSGEVDNEYPDDFNYTEFPLSDTHTDRADKYFDKAYEVILQAKKDGKKVLVFCKNGKGISPTIIMAYMLKASKSQDKYLPLAKCFAKVWRDYPGVDPNDNFMQQLLSLEKDLYEENSMRLKGKGGGRGRGGRGRGGKGRGKGRRGK